MSVRENTALQAALVLFVAVIAVLAVTAYVYYSSLQTERETTAQLLCEIEQLRREQTASQREAETLKGIVGGYSRETSLANIRHDHALDVCEVFPRKDHLDPAPYRALVSHLVRSVRDAAQREAEALERERARTRQIEAIERQHEARVDVHRRTQADMAAELAAARQRLHAARQESVERWNALADQLEEKVALLADWELKHDRMRKSFARDLDKVQRRYEVMRDRWEESLPNKDFAAPLGRITHVDGRARTVTIDLGRADLLPRGLALSVFTGPADNVAGKKPKGKIEVMRIVGDHAAEARVTEDLISDLILPGDVIYTPVWKVGQQRRFALVGNLDVDGDGEDDLKQVRQLIERQGGKIDAVVDATGKQTGRITVDTWCLVVGGLPSGAGESDEAPTAFAELFDQADELGVDRMSLDRFLETVGYVRGPTTQQLSRHVSRE
jgi:hypothetical protein